MVRFTESVHLAGVPLGFAGRFIRRQDGSGNNGSFFGQYLDDGYLYGQCSLALGMETGEKYDDVISASLEKGDDLLMYMVLGTGMYSAVACSHKKDDTTKNIWMSCHDPVDILLSKEGIKGRKRAAVLDAEFQRHVGDLFPLESEEESKSLLISNVLISLNLCHKVSFMVRADAVDPFLRLAKTQYSGVLHSLLVSDIVDLNVLQ